MSVSDRFDDSYIPEPNSGCWLWMGSATGERYLRAMLADGAGKMIGATRYAYERFVGPLGVGQIACHKCDVSLCVNPAHLYAGTYKSNRRDADERGLSAMGERHRYAKLNADLVRSIRRDIRPAAVIARQLGVSDVVVRAARKGLSWKHVS